MTMMIDGDVLVVIMEVMENLLSMMKIPKDQETTIKKTCLLAVSTTSGFQEKSCMRSKEV